MQTQKSRPQVKICGLTRVDEALACVDLGADAIGCVFYPQRPRYVSPDQAGDICRALPQNVTTVGVFVNDTFFKIMNTVKRCRLRAVQLHGGESPRLVQALCEENIIVIKALFRDGSPSIDDVKNYRASAYLIECGKGPLPGGNAMQWPWETAGGFGKAYPFILAGGLSAANVKHAVTSSAPDAVDVSSGVESTPGRKDLTKVKDFMEAISQGGYNKQFRRIF